MTATRVAIAGVTGSIGVQTLDVVRADPTAYEVVAIAASGANVDPLDRKSVV